MQSVRKIVSCCSIEDAGDLVRLYHIVHLECDSVKSVNSETDSLGLVKVCTLKSLETYITCSELIH